MLILTEIFDWEYLAPQLLHSKIFFLLKSNLIDIFVIGDVDNNKIKEIFNNIEFKIVSLEEGKGFAPSQDSDPTLLRIVLEK